MPFPSNQNEDRFFNNADSFAMMFDDKWKSYSSTSKKIPRDTEEKLEIILTQIKDHPFLQNYPDKAKEIAKFRLRLLNLE